MKQHVYEKYDGGDVTDSMLQDAADLFSENYGVWSEQAAQAVGKFAKAGSRVRLNKERLRAQCLPEDTATSYVRVAVDGRLTGHVFACHWTAGGKTACWVTQLVVRRESRERGLAMGLLCMLRRPGVNVYGIISSHPAACLAAAKVFGGKHKSSTVVYCGIGSIDSLLPLGFIREHAQTIMGASPIEYVKDAKLRGSVFAPDDTSGLVSSVDTGFSIDHTEPLEALARVRGERGWPLGELLDGHEFLLICKASPRQRYLSRSKSGPVV